MRSRVSRKATSSSPRSLTRTGGQSGAGSSHASRAGIQYRRIASPMGVPRSTRVSSLLSSRESMRRSSSPYGGWWSECIIGPMKRLLALVALASVTAGCRDSIEGHFIYYPSRTLSADPSSVGLAFRDIVFTAADGVRLHGWLIPGRTPTTLLYSHGNAGNIGGRVAIARLLADQLGVGLFMYDYRGYGSSDGAPSEAGLHSDADETIPYAQGRALFAAAPEPKTFFTIRGAHHYDMQATWPEYWAAWRAFLTAAAR